MTPELAPLSPNYHTSPKGEVRFSSRRIYRASLPYTAGLQRYWARTMTPRPHKSVNSTPGPPRPVQKMGHHLEKFKNPYFRVRR
ncbi:hypothetical protein TNCV_2376881 [Trichonephila clavipes]|nr:hypothetical protein TNCV_2376881 [Trichonephila clavipes]